RFDACRRCGRSRPSRVPRPSRCPRVDPDAHTQRRARRAVGSWSKCSRKRHNLHMSSLSGVSVLVAGAGLAGLTAARDLVGRGASVTVIEARDRVGGRVWTIREGFAEGQHAEAGGDMIDEAQHEIRSLAGEHGLTMTRILRSGFAYVRLDGSGKPRIISRS